MQYLAKPVDVDTLLAAFETGARPNTEEAPAAKPFTVNRLEWEHIPRVGHEHEGNISVTARVLRIHRRTLQRKLAQCPARSWS